MCEQARVASGLAADAERRIAQLDGGLPQAAGVGVEVVADLQSDSAPLAERAKGASCRENCGYAAGLMGVWR